MAENTSIIIKGARVNNLKNIDVEIPRNKLVVITGLSGSGKSSLAFDTLYAEGQRRYVESLSSYARQFLGRMSKPECDFIKGIPPAIAIEQKVSSRNPRSTVGTSTEIYEYLRLLYARVGKTFSPVSGQEVKKHSAEDIVKCMLEYPEGTRYTVLAPILLREDRTLQQQLEIDMKQGFTRLEVNGEMMRIDEYKPKEGDTVFLLIDRMTAPLQSMSSQADRLTQAFRQTNGEMRSLQNQQRLISAFHSQSASVRQTQTEFAQAHARLATLRQQMQATANPSQTLVRNFQQAERTVERLNQRLQSQNQTLTQTRDRLNALGMNTSNLAADEQRLAQAINRTNTELEQRRRRMEQVQQIQERYHRQQEKLQNIRNTSTAVAVGGGY